MTKKVKPSKSSRIVDDFDPYSNYRHRRPPLFSINFVLPILLLLFIIYCTLISISVDKFNSAQQLVNDSITTTTTTTTTKTADNNFLVVTENDDKIQLPIVSNNGTFANLDKYLVNTEKCHVKEWPTFDWQTIPLFNNVSGHHYRCYPFRRFWRHFNIRRVNFTSVKIEIRGGKKRPWKCYAREIVRNRANDRVRYSPYFGPIQLDQDFNRTIRHKLLKKRQERTAWDAVQIMCNRTGSGNESEVYQHVVPLVQKHFDTKKVEPPDPAKPNIILIGVDSISRLQFIRHFLETKQIVDKHDLIELKGHHKVGDNTFPNLFAMFTGHHAYEYWNWTDYGYRYKFDKIPLIFKNFSRNGWITTYIEDMPQFGTFHHNKGGFRESPADYYMRPVNLALRPELNNYFTCYRNKLEFEVYYDFLLDLFRLYQLSGNQRHFSFAHWSTLTHDYFNAAGYADQLHAKFLRQLFSQNFHRNSLIILFSDHGIRFGPIMKTQAGIHELRLPYLFFYVPETMRLDGRNATQLKQILRLNANRLTSHFDLYSTFVHLLSGNGTLANKSNKFGRSLLTPIPLNRTCADAGISEEFCLCNSWAEIQPNDYHVHMTYVVLNLINQRLAPYRDKCARLKLWRVSRVMILQKDLEPEMSTDRRYMIHFRTKPGLALFEVSVLAYEPEPWTQRNRHPSDPVSLRIIGDVIRLDRYSIQAKCVAKQNLRIERYCYCV